MSEHDDEAVNRLRAADPAIGSQPDLHAVRSRLAGRTPLEEGGGFQFSAPGDVAVRVHDPANRTNRVPMMAAAAIAAVGLGVGGYLLGNQQVSPGSDTSSGADTRPDAGQVDEAGPGAEAGSPGAEAGSPPSELGGPSSGDIGMQGGTSARESAPMGGSDSWSPYGNAVLEAGPGLPDEPSTAEVFARQAPDADPDELLRDWADRLEMAGAPVEMDDQRMIVDGQRAVAVSTYAGGVSLNYNNLALDPYCLEMSASAMSAGERADARAGLDEAESTQAFPVPEPEDCVPSTPIGDDSTAIAMTEEFFTTMGLDPADYRFEVIHYDSEVHFSEESGDGATVTAGPGTSSSSATGEVVSMSNVQAYPAGQPGSTEPDFTAQVTGEGVVNLYGTLGDYASIGSYPVISAVEAVERFGDPVFANSGVFYVPEPYTEGEPYGEPWVYEEPDPVTLIPGEPIPYPVNRVTITSAELTQGVLQVPGSGTVQVPAWRLVDEDGGHYHVLALADEALDITP